uniref:Chromosome 8 open reading frame 34 n=1 Tax=Leptobrachium leishanense TaxID=445787 RepID=A0A8C5MQW1_9ANUR
MASRQQNRIQVYLETNRIGPLFEELMTRLITETPDQPIPFLISHLQSKIGHVGHLQRTLSGSAALWADNESPENKGIRRDFRSYDKPWQVNAKKPKKSKSDLAVCNISPTSPESKSLPRSLEQQKWDWRTKPDSHDFDELNHILQESKKLGKALENLSRSIAVTDELEQDTRAFNSSLLRPCVIGEWVGREDNDPDPLAAEMIQPPIPRNKNEQREEEEGCSSPAGSLKMEPKNKGLKQQQQQHKKLLAAMLSQDSFDSVHSTPASVTEEDIDNEDDAMELLEDLDDLRMEGVTSLMPSGSKFSQGRSTYTTEPQAKVTLNICSRCARLQGDNLAHGVEEAAKQSTSSEKATAESTGTALLPGVESVMEDDDEIESASQVTGPRQPVWDSEALSARSGGSQSQKLLKEALTAKELQSMEKHLADIEKDLALMAEASMAKSPSNQQGGAVTNDQQSHHLSQLQNARSQLPNQATKSLQLHLQESKTHPPLKSSGKASSLPNSRPQTPNLQSNKLQAPLTPLGRPVTPNNLLSRPLTPSSLVNKDVTFAGQRNRTVTVRSQVGWTTSPLSGGQAQVAMDTLGDVPQKNSVSEEESFEQLQGSRQPWTLPSDTDSESIDAEKVKRL